MTKSELIERIVTHQGLLSSKDVELAIKTMLEQMSQCLATGDRIEIRGFGSFSLHYRAPRVGRNPKPVSPSASTASSFRISSRENCVIV
jgi:integration host factor subunit beta